MQNSTQRKNNKTLLNVWKSNQKQHKKKLKRKKQNQDVDALFDKLIDKFQDTFSEDKTNKNNPEKSSTDDTKLPSVLKSKNNFRKLMLKYKHYSDKEIETLKTVPATLTLMKNSDELKR